MLKINWKRRIVTVSYSVYLEYITVIQIRIPALTEIQW